MNRLDRLNLITAFEYYLLLALIVGLLIRARTYISVLGMIYRGRQRWPKLLELMKTNRAVFLSWPTLLAAGSVMALLLANFLANRLVWVEAKVSFEQLSGRWVPFFFVAITGILMVLLDGEAIFSARRFDRAALEVDLDKAEHWMGSWTAPAVRILTFGLVHPRKLVGEEVARALEKANWVMIGGLWHWCSRIGMKFAFGLSLWTTWAVVIRPRG